jgi:hypothetical protein
VTLNQRPGKEITRGKCNVAENSNRECALSGENFTRGKCNVAEKTAIGMHVGKNTPGEVYCSGKHA